MKSLTVRLPDDVLERAERRAAERGATLPNEIADFVVHYGEGTAAVPVAKGEAVNSADLGRLLAALAAGRNDVSVRPLSRDGLYDRPILH